MPGPDPRPIVIQVVAYTAGAEPAPGPPRLLLTPGEVAETLGVNRSTIYALLRDGAFPSVFIGRARRIPLQAIEEWIARVATFEYMSE